MDSGANPDASTRRSLWGRTSFDIYVTESMVFTRKVRAYIPQLLSGKSLAKLKASLSKLGNKAVNAVSAKAYSLTMAVAA